jgi:hypothetical protein
MASHRSGAAEKGQTDPFEAIVGIEPVGFQKLTVFLGAVFLNRKNAKEEVRKGGAYRLDRRGVMRRRG